MNVAKHANAQYVIVQFRQSPNKLHLSIRVDGIGFDVQATRDRVTYGSS